jgi:hypothetical protein
MRFYELTNNTSFERQWPTAVSIRATSHVVRWSCPDCGRAASFPAGSFDVTIEGGTDYPDILDCGAYPMLIVSGKVLSLWQRNDIGPFLQYPVKVSAVLDTRLRPENSPAYFHVKVAGSAKVDIPGSGGKVINLCFRCGEFDTEPTLIRKLSLLDGSWDGSHLFRDCRLFPSVAFCTQAVKELTLAEALTNFRFDEMSSVLVQQPFTTESEGTGIPQNSGDS